MSLSSQIGLLATAVGNYLRDSIVPRLLPSAGTAGQVIVKVDNTNYNVMWQTPFSGAYADLSGKPTLFSGAYDDLSGKPTLFSGAYTDLTGKPTLGSAAALNITVSATAPSSPATGDVWIDIS